MDGAFVKRFARELGASVVGVAPVDRFTGSPRGHSPVELMPGAKSVVVIGLKLLDTVVEWPSLFQNSEILQNDEVRQLVAQNHVYMGSGYRIVNRHLEDIALRLSYVLDDAGYKSLFFPATYADDAGIMEKVPEFHAPFSHRHAAVLAGLGEFGLNNLVLSPEYGPRIRFISVITAAPLKPDPLLTDKVCLGEKCNLCITECKTGSLPEATDLPEGIWLTPPTEVDKRTCFTDHGPDGCIGTCLRVCPVGKR